MALLIYSAICSLDGFIEDSDGRFDWAEPDPEAHQFFNDLDRDAGTYLYGRRMYETMMVWETEPSLAAFSPVTRDFAEIWQAADKIVYSKALGETPTRRTRIERNFEPEAVRQLKASEGRDILIGGPTLAAHAFQAGLVDEVQLVLTPIVIGSGKRGLPSDLRLKLELLDQRQLSGGMVFLHYRVGS